MHLSSWPYEFNSGLDVDGMGCKAPRCRRCEREAGPKAVCLGESQPLGKPGKVGTGRRREYLPNASQKTYECMYRSFGYGLTRAVHSWIERMNNGCINFLMELSIRSFYRSLMLASKSGMRLRFLG